MSRKKRLESYRKRMRQLEGKIRVAQIELDELKKKATFLHAELAVEAMPESQRTALGFASMSTNLEPRPPVIRD
jgi:prefoldin subunit 5